MDSKEFQIKVETAKTRLEYFTNLNAWCIGYLTQAEKSTIDGVKIDSNITIAITELKDRLIEEIVKDGISIAKHNLSGINTWNQPPNL